MTHIAVVQFPGSNCESETRAALNAAGAQASIVRWNVPRERWVSFDGFVLPGGFSYEDRVRAGALAAKHAVLDEIAAAVDAGKPVLGVCNGAQVLVEAGLVPGIEPGHVEVALAPNDAPDWSEYYCGWVHLQVEGESCLLQELRSAPAPIPMPVGHGEGRFTGKPELFEDLASRQQIVLRYVGADGTPARGFPENPNGSLYDVAALSDPSGRVVALMPHPERGAWLYQVPEELCGPWGVARRAAMGRPVSLRGPGPGLALYQGFVAAARATAGTAV